MRSLKDLIVVVTGASQGIGRGIVEQFVAEKAKVVLVARNKERLQKVAQSLGRDLLGRQASREDFLIVAVDIIRRRNMKRIITAAVKKFGRIDIFVNNAGVGIHKPMVETNETEFNTIFDTNLKAIYYSFLELIPLFKSQGGGQIINISSGAGRFGMPGLAVYSASKAALNAFSEAVAGEVRNDNIKISVLAPASTDTKLMSNMLKESRSPSKATMKLTVSEVAEAVIFLAKQNANAWTSMADIRPLLINK